MPSSSRSSSQTRQSDARIEVVQAVDEHYKDTNHHDASSKDAHQDQAPRSPNVAQDQDGNTSQAPRTPMMAVPTGMPNAYAMASPMMPNWNPSMAMMMPMSGGIPMGYMQPVSSPYAQGVSDYNPLVPRMSLPQGVPIGRTVYIGNLPSDASVDELLNLVKFGPIENVKLLPEKNCAFISFLTAQTAAAFHADSSVRHITLHGQQMKIGWGKPSVPPPAVMLAVQQQQASRNVYIGQLDESTTEKDLRDDLTRFGPIDQVKIVRDQAIAFIHFLSIQTAMKVVAVLPTEPKWSGKRVNYGKDRCAYVPKGQQQIQAHNHQAAAIGLAAATWLGYPTGYVNQTNANYVPHDNSVSAHASLPSDMNARMQQPHPFGPVEPQYHQFGNRTVYLGNLHPDTNAEDICNHVRGGILQNVRYMPDRHISFVTFVDANAALAFFHMASMTGITIHTRRLKVGWGKPSGPLSPAMALAVQRGASRNVYLGNIDDPEMLNEEKIRSDLSEYGELEMVNTLKERNCAFANFLNIQSAIKCIEGLRYHKDYQSIKISFGKDRCGNPPRYLSELPLNRNGIPSKSDASADASQSSTDSSHHTSNKPSSDPPKPSSAT
ncbi:hypothetical protein MYAM1_002946 [Malassezia yamatoensis]|uniref:RRM domain-containing protein n=1 Tax=Malassezia yamatoensis TaxID=253288 RepID=A0AAJ6CHF1_9BASI|nr:hypothetical protein MYAM1_002946 [Malassezia yamatoensis]